MSGVFFYTLLLSFASGIFLRSFFVIPGTGVAWVALLGATLGVWAYHKRAFLPARYVIVLTCFCVGIALGMWRYDLALSLTPAPLLLADVGSVHTYIGEVVREPEVVANSTNLVVRIGEELVLVKTDRHTPTLYGDTVTVVGKVAEPAAFMTDLGREFDYPRYLRAKGIAYTMSFAQVTVTDTTTGNPILRFLFATKTQFIEALEVVLSEPQVGLGTGLLLGVKQSLGAELETSFRRAGIIHIVVLSGYNIMLVVQFVLLVLTRFLSLRWRVVVGVVAIAGFALMVGLGASVLRASIMAALGLAALVLDRQYAVTRALFVAGAVMLLVNPYLLVSDIGFQLSFMATLGLLLVVPQITAVVAWVPRLFGVREFLLATVATQIAVLPILLYNMGEFSIISLVVNVLVLPLVAPAMLLTFVTGLVALVSPALALPFAYSAYVVLTYIIGVATKFAALPFAVANVPFFPWYGVFLFYAILGTWLYWRVTRAATLVPAQSIDLSPVAEWEVVEEGDIPVARTHIHTDTDTATATKNGRAGVAHPSPASSGETETPIFFR